jgi:type IV secretion system protein VirB5
MASPAGAEIVFDPNVFARQFEQLTELKKQVDTLTSQLKIAQDQLSQAKQLYDSFNKLTNANDIGALLNTPQFRKVLPQQFADIEKLVAVRSILRTEMPNEPLYGGLARAGLPDRKSGVAA